MKKPTAYGRPIHIKSFTHNGIRPQPILNASMTLVVDDFLRVSRVEAQHHSLGKVVNILEASQGYEVYETIQIAPSDGDDLGFGRDDVMAIIREEATRVREEAIRVQTALIKGRVIKEAPGSALVRFSTWFLRDDAAKTLLQSVADMREEYFDALSLGDEREAKKAYRRWVFRACIAFFHQVPWSLLKTMAELWKLGGGG